jgi:DNA-binding NarL/FixJ family response regulator
MSLPVIRVYLIDDHAVLRASLRDLIEQQAGMLVCGEAATAGIAIAEIAQAAPDVALVDVSLPDMNGIALVRILHRQYPALALTMLSAHAEDPYIHHALAAGASGYVLKGRSAALLQAIRRLGALRCAQAAGTG